LNKLSFLFGGPAGIRLELDSCLDDEAERWRFCLLDHAGHRSHFVERLLRPNFKSSRRGRRWQRLYVFSANRSLVSAATDGPEFDGPDNASTENVKMVLIATKSESVFGAGDSH